MIRIKVLIQQSLLKDLEGFIFTYNQNNKKKLKRDYAVFFVSLFNSISSHYRDSRQQENKVWLNSQILKKYYSGYTVYINFLLKSKIIELVSNHSTDKKESRCYKLNEKYIHDDIVSYEITDKILLKKFLENKSDKDKLDYCKSTRPYLVKWFDENLTINAKQAYKTIIPFKIENYRKFQNGMQLITEFNYQDWKYSIKPDSDNRLHSNLTRLNKILRPFLRYKGESLGAVDIKSSQPYFFSVVLKAILKKDKELLKQINATHLLTDENIDKLFSLKIDRNEVIEFVQSVLQGDIYIKLSQELNITYDKQGKPFRMVTNYENKNKTKINYDKPRIKEVYETERDLAKSILMEIFFSKPKTTIPEAKIFRTKFPSISKIMDFIKTECIEFHKLLSNIESYCLLDYVALKFSQKYPSIPLWSIHDSLVTTEKHVKLLEQETIKLLKEITTIQPQVVKELYNNK